MTDQTCQKDIEQGNAALTSGNFAEALACFERALEAMPNDARINAKVGAAQYKLRNYPAAIKHLEYACELKTGDKDLLYSLGMVYIKAGEKTKALATYDKLKKLNPEKAEDLYRAIYS